MIEWIIIAAFIAMGIFQVTNQYSAKHIRGLFNSFKYSIYTLPLQIGAYMLLSFAFGEGFKYYSGRYWMISLIVTFASYAMNLIVAWIMFKQIPVKGQAVGFILMLIGIIVATLWK